MLEWTISTRQTKFSKEQGDIYIPIGSMKGKTNSPNTRIARWDFINGKTYRFPMKCRAVRFRLNTGYETLLTNLPSEEFSASDLKELYVMRWKTETSFRYWKYVVVVLNLHSRTDVLIFQEIFSSLIMYNFANRIIREIEIPQKPGNKYRYEVDRTMGIYLCKRFFRDPDFSGEKLIRDIMRYTQPVRPNRADVRDLRVRPATSFPYRIPS